MIKGYKITEACVENGGDVTSLVIISGVIEGDDFVQVGYIAIPTKAEGQPGGESYCLVVKGDDEPSSDDESLRRIAKNPDWDAVNILLNIVGNKQPEWVISSGRPKGAALH